jgi:multidrug resistance efflux pump
MTSNSTPTPLVSVARVIIFGGAALCLGVATAGWLDQRHGVTAVAVLEAKTTSIAAGRDCRLAEVLSQTGSVVTPGTPLLRFFDERLEQRIAAKTREVSEVTAEWERCEAAADVELAWRLRELQHEIYQTQGTITKLSQERLSQQVAQIAWQEHLQTVDRWADQTTSVSSIRPVTMTTPVPDAARLEALLKEDTATAAVEALEAQLTLSAQRLDTLRKLEQELQQKVRISVGVEVAKTRQERVSAELASLNEQLTALTITSTRHGTVGPWHHQPGDLVQTGDVVVELYDDAQRSLAAIVPSACAPLMTPDAEVELMFPGSIRRRGKVTAFPPQTRTTATTEHDAELSIRIEPIGKLWPTPPLGTRVEIALPAAG